MASLRRNLLCVSVKSVPPSVNLVAALYTACFTYICMTMSAVYTGRPVRETFRQDGSAILWQAQGQGDGVGHMADMSEQSYLVDFDEVLAPTS